MYKNRGRGQLRGKRKEMNGLELAYSKELDRRKEAGEIDRWKFNAITLVVAQPPNALAARWTPDFSVWTNPDMVLEFHETKGFMREHAQVKIKAAAEQYPHPIYVIKQRAKKDGGGFEITEM